MESLIVPCGIFNCGMRDLVLTRDGTQTLCFGSTVLAPGPPGKSISHFWSCIFLWCAWYFLYYTSRNHTQYQTFQYLLQSCPSKSGGPAAFVSLGSQLDSTEIPSQLDHRNFSLTNSPGDLCSFYSLRSTVLRSTKQKLSKYFETWGPGNPRRSSVLPSHLTILQFWASFPLGPQVALCSLTKQIWA